MGPTLPKIYMLVVPDDHGGMGHNQVGQATWYPHLKAVEAEWLIDPNVDTWGSGKVHPLMSIGPLKGCTFVGAFPNLQGLADFTGYAVTETDGTLVYQPKEVFRYARRDPLLWEL